MEKYRIVALVDYIPFIVSSDGTIDGTIVEEGPVAYRLAFNKALAESFSVRMGDGYNAPRAIAEYTPLGLTAAIFSIHPAYTKILRAPKEVRDMLSPFPEQISQDASYAKMQKGVN